MVCRCVGAGAALAGLASPFTLTWEPPTHVDFGAVPGCCGLDVSCPRAPGLGWTITGEMAGP